MTQKEIAARERLIQSGARLFGEKGYAGVSVREICKHAGTSMNMIHHYFENKEGLLSAVVNQFSDNVFSLPNKLLEKTPRSKDDFQSRIEMIFESTLDAFIEERMTLLVVSREQPKLQPMVDYMGLIVSFMDRSKKKGFIRKEIDPDLIAGFMIDRILNRVLYAPWVKDVTGDDIMNDSEYKKKWCKTNLDLILYGVMVR